MVNLCFEFEFEKLHQTLEKLFHPICKNLEVGLKKLGYAQMVLWKSDEILFHMFDVFHLTFNPNNRSDLSTNPFSDQYVPSALHRFCPH